MTETGITQAPLLAVILPCYNEEEALPGSLAALCPLLQGLAESGKIARESFILCVDDGSEDGTWQVITAAHEADSRVRGLKFAGNAGHQNALLAGMLSVKDSVDCAITIDADLQDDISVIEEMIDAYTGGSQVVYGVRRGRRVDSFFKRNTAALFYAGMKHMGTAIIPGHADFRLVGRLALGALEEYRESGLFLRTLFPAMKLSSSCVYYERKSRQAGSTKYPFRKMLAFAMQGIASSSPFPLRISAALGFVTLIFALIQSIAAIYAYVNNDTVVGWTSLALIVLYIGAVQLFCLALLGEYIARIFMEVKRRPRYIIEKELK